MSTDCEECKPNHQIYNPKLSKTADKAEEAPFTAMYGPYFVTGDDYKDTVCFYQTKTDQTCVKDFRFLSVFSYDPRIIDMDGMAGLAPDDPANGPSFVAALYNAKIIEKKMFGFIFGKGTRRNQITFGGYDKSLMKESTTQVKWFRQTNATRWEIDIQDIAIGGKSIWQDTRKAVIDTFFKTIAVPRNEFNLFKDYLLEFI